jgi:hypothetical protein
LDTWKLVKPRTAAGGAVWRSRDGTLFKRTGGIEVRDEARFQRMLAEQGFPVPRIVQTGRGQEGFFFVEQSLGTQSLHDMAIRDTQETGAVRQTTVDTAAKVSARLLTAQLRTAEPSGQAADWVRRAGFVDTVFAENPDLDTHRTCTALDTVSTRLSGVPVSFDHLDYGLPNVFPTGVIDWQHHALVPVGFDVYPMLDIAAFKGGDRGYIFTRSQRRSYLAALDEVSENLAGLRLSRFLGDFLLVKCFFFLALMRPKDPNDRRKQAKWAYRRKLLALGLDSYERDHRIDTAAFPTLTAFPTDYDRKDG